MILSYAGSYRLTIWGKPYTLCPPATSMGDRQEDSGESIGEQKWYTAENTVSISGAVIDVSGL